MNAYAASPYGRGPPGAVYPFIDGVLYDNVAWDRPFTTKAPVEGFFGTVNISPQARLNAPCAVPGGTRAPQARCQDASSLYGGNNKHVGSYVRATELGWVESDRPQVLFSCRPSEIQQLNEAILKYMPHAKGYTGELLANNFLLLKEIGANAKVGIMIVDYQGERHLMLPIQFDQHFYEGCTNCTKQVLQCNDIRGNASEEIYQQCLETQSHIMFDLEFPNGVQPVPMAYKATPTGAAVARNMFSRCRNWCSEAASGNLYVGAWQ